MTDDAGAQLAAIAATEIERMQRLAQLGNRGTSGPDQPPSSRVAPPAAATSSWRDGWWSSGAAIRHAHSARVGGLITPWAIVVHTTDEPPELGAVLLDHWQNQPGDGSCTHFFIGRDSGIGVVQLIPINRNGNHAGGARHGVFDTARGTNYHPNLVTVGIELHCAGGVRLINGAWYYVENGVIHSAPIPAADVIPDPQRPGRGWHVVTEYQLQQLALLRAALETQLAPLPTGAVSRSVGEAVPSWGVPSSARVVGHVSLDPADRSDPWPPTMKLLR